MEEDFREWSRIQSYLSARSQMAVNIDRVLMYRELAKAVCAHYKGLDEVTCPGFVAQARALTDESRAT